ncbi:SEC-C domain-containing protein [Burkholderia cenocepacia]|uniref:SEC-C metal-binding domain-containing protein n=1 Tax=Burkholderia cenocepacia TaxID=95486 RepID=UPI001CF42A4F|nr:SEC-C metal-binding domain-containing protein [Burkholderia cenocepacia]MCA8407953.1 SEC-C domain-containing protein [Burkholderia cenocepacia]
MARIPALCESCGKTFPSGIQLDGGHHNTFIGFKFKCPHCGGTGQIVDGTYDSPDGVISLVKIFANRRISADQVAQIKQILEEAKRTDASPEDITAQLEDADAGDLAKALWSWICDGTNRTAGLGQWISVILAVLAMIASSKSNVTEDDVRRIMKEQEQQHQVAPAPRITPLTLPAYRMQVKPAPGEPSQNSPCPCGSGKKYKHCHGTKRWDV